MRKLLAVLVSLTLAVTLGLTSFTALGASAAQSEEEPGGTTQSISELKGQIYAGSAIADGILDPGNSSWDMESVEYITLTGEDTASTLIAMDASLTAGISVDACIAPQLYFYNTEINILPVSEGGMNSGCEILGYEEDLYGSGYGTSYAADAMERFYGTTINGPTYGGVLNGGRGIYQGLKGGTAYSTANMNGETIAAYEAREDIPTMVNTIWGIMNLGSGTIDFNEGSIWNSAEGTVLCKEADTVWNFQGAELHPGNGIIFQMMDNDEAAIGGADTAAMYLEEKPGFPTDAYDGTATYTHTEDEEVDPDKTYYQAYLYTNTNSNLKSDTGSQKAGTGADAGAAENYPEIRYTSVTHPTREGLITYFERNIEIGKAEVHFADGAYEGCVYNGTGYYGQAPDALFVTIAEDAELTGDIALTSHVHGIFLDDRDVEDVIAAIEKANADQENITYVFLDTEGRVTQDKEKAAAIQFTKFSNAESCLLGHVINQTHYNGLAVLDVTVEGTWTPVAEALVTRLEIKDGAHVKGEVTRLEDGSILIQPSDKELAPGIYGEVQ